MLMVPTTCENLQIGHGGNAYIFNTSGEQLHKLVPNDPANEGYFGRSVGISGSTIVVGTSGAQKAYIFNTDGQQLTQVGTYPGLFGFSVAISGSTFVVGASMGDSGNGATYIFNTDGQLLQKLTVPNV